MAYLTDVEREDAGCPSCVERATAQALPGLIVRTEALVYATLNLYPYNNGHLLILPYRHVSDLTELTTEEANALMALLIESRRILQAALAPEAFNAGLNLGAAGGAGVPNHLHFHLVPRWSGDTNFMPVVGDTKVMPETLDQTKARLVEAWRAMAGADDPAQARGA